MKGIQEIVFPYEEVEGLLQRLDAGALTEDDLGIIKAYLLLSQAVQDNHAKIKRLLRMLFGAKTEKAETVGVCPASQGKAAMERSVETAQDSGEDTGEKPKGHGRNGASAYTGAEKIALSHPVLKPGDACPGCQRGKVYHMPTPGAKVNPFDYLMALQKHAQEVLKSPHEWLPWNYKAEVLRRQREHSS